MSTMVVESTTIERLPVVVTTFADPTGSSVSFAVTTADTQPSTWVAGSWSTTWSVVTGEATALTPLVGDGQALDLNPGVDYDLWVRWSAAGETPVRHVGRVRVT